MRQNCPYSIFSAGVYITGAFNALRAAGSFWGTSYASSSVIWKAFPIVYFQACFSQNASGHVSPYLCVLYWQNTLSCPENAFIKFQPPVPILNECRQRPFRCFYLLPDIFLYVSCPVLFAHESCGHMPPDRYMCVDGIVIFQPSEKQHRRIGALLFFPTPPSVATVTNVIPGVWLIPRTAPAISTLFRSSRVSASFFCSKFNSSMEI